MDIGVGFSVDYLEEETLSLWQLHFRCSGGYSGASMDIQTQISLNISFFDSLT